MLQKLLIQLPSQLACAGGGAVREKGVGGAVLQALAAAAAAAYRKFQ